MRLKHTSLLYENNNKAILLTIKATGMNKKNDQVKGEHYWKIILNTVKKGLISSSFAKTKSKNLLIM
jgi:hypothetical protein